MTANIDQNFIFCVCVCVVLTCQDEQIGHTDHKQKGAW